jgi:hypothetical protein
MDLDESPRLDGANLAWGLIAGFATAIGVGLGGFFLV